LAQTGKDWLGLLGARWRRLVIAFLSVLDRHYSRARHLVLDNYAIHSRTRSTAALDAYDDRFVLHFLRPTVLTRTGSSASGRTSTRTSRGTTDATRCSHFSGGRDASSALTMEAGIDRHRPSSYPRCMICSRITPADLDSAGPDSSLPVEPPRRARRNNARLPPAERRRAGSSRGPLARQARSAQDHALARAHPSFIIETAPGSPTSSFAQWQRSADLTRSPWKR